MLKLILMCDKCGVKVDEQDIPDDVKDPATLVCEMAADLNFEHECKEKTT